MQTTGMGEQLDEENSRCEKENERPKRKVGNRFNKIAIQGAPQMAVDKEAISLSRVYSYYSKYNLPLFYV